MNEQINPIDQKINALNEALMRYQDNLNNGIVLNFFDYSDNFMLSDDIAKFVRAIIDRKDGKSIDDFQKVEEKATLLLYCCCFYLYFEAPIDKHNLFMVEELLEATQSTNDDSESDLDRLFGMLEEKEPQHMALLHYAAYKVNDIAADRPYIIKMCQTKLAPLFSSKSDNIFSYIRGTKDIPKLSKSIISNLSKQKDIVEGIGEYEERLLIICLEIFYYSDFLNVEKNAKNFMSIIENFNSKINEIITQNEYPTIVEKYNIFISDINTDEIAIELILKSLISRFYFFKGCG